MKQVVYNYANTKIEILNYDGAQNFANIVNNGSSVLFNIHYKAIQLNLTSFEK